MSEHQPLCPLDGQPCDIPGGCEWVCNKPPSGPDYDALARVCIGAVIVCLWLGGVAAYMGWI